MVYGIEALYFSGELIWFLICLMILHEWGHFLWAKYIDHNFIRFSFRMLKFIPDGVMIEPVRSRMGMMCGFIGSLPALVFMPDEMTVYYGIAVLASASIMDFYMAINLYKSQAMDRESILDELKIRPIFPKKKRKRWQIIILKMCGRVHENRRL